MRQAALRAVTLLPAAVVDDDDEREYWTMTVPWGCLITRDEERSAEHVCIHLMTCLILNLSIYAAGQYPMSIPWNT